MLYTSHTWRQRQAAFLSTHPHSWYFDLLGNISGRNTRRDRNGPTEGRKKSSELLKISELEGRLSLARSKALSHHSPIQAGEREHS